MDRGARQATIYGVAKESNPTWQLNNNSYPLKGFTTNKGNSKHQIVWKILKLWLGKAQSRCAGSSFSSIVLAGPAAGTHILFTHLGFTGAHTQDTVLTKPLLVHMAPPGSLENGHGVASLETPPSSTWHPGF